jgi:hypothetical protein
MSAPMNHTTPAAIPFTLSRRALVKSFAFAGAALAVLPCAFHAALTAGGHAVAEMRPPVVSFYMDRPYLDPTGTAMPYLLPRGARSGAPLALLSEEAFRSAQCCV